MKSVKCFAMLGAACVAITGASHAGVTYDTASVPDTLIVNVDADGATLDVSKVTANITNIVKVGAGILTSAALQNYAGDITINEGVYDAVQKYALGKDNAGTVYVNDGASLGDGLVIDNWSERTSYGKKFVFDGEPAKGTTAKLFRSAKNGRSYIGHTSTFTLLSDTTIDCSYERLKLNGVVDLGGNKLTICRPLSTWTQIQFDCMVTNGGTIYVRGEENYKDARGLTFQNEGSRFGFYPSEQHRELILTNSHYEARTDCYANGATLTLIDSYAGTYKFGLPSKYDTFRWDGPVNSYGASSIASYTEQTNVFNVAGNIGGNGTLTIGPGWLNLSDAPESTFSGDVVIKAVNNAKTPREYSGLAVLDDSPLFPVAKSVTIKDGASLLFPRDYSQQIPKLTITGNEEAILKGGVTPNGDVERNCVSGILKTGDGVLNFENSMRVTGKTEVLGGTLKIPSKVYGRAGLWEWVSVDMSKGENVSGQNAWCTANDFNKGYITTNQADAVYSRYGAEKVFSGYPSVKSNDIIRATAAVYKGYIWNRTGEPVTWQFAMHMKYRGELVVNDKWTNWYPSENGTNIVDVTLQPGANPIVIYSLSASWNANQEISTRFDGLGLSYDPNPVAGETNVANFVKLDDGGTGRLFTIDEDDSREAAANLLPVFDDLSFTTGAKFDLNGNAFVQGSLSGFPVVENGDLTVTNVWNVSTADIASGSKMTVDGLLTFAEGAKIASSDVLALNGKNVKEYLIATAGSVIGKPGIDADSPALANWRVMTTETEVKLVYVAPGTVFIIR